MRFGDRRATQRNMTFYALEFRIRLSRINFRVQNAAVVRSCRNMTRSAGKDGNFFGFLVKRVHRRDIVASRTRKVGVAGEFVAKSAGRMARSPRVKRDFIGFH